MDGLIQRRPWMVEAQRRRWGFLNGLTSSQILDRREDEYKDCKSARVLSKDGRV
jgi:hypothetical protein